MACGITMGNGESCVNGYECDRFTTACFDSNKIQRLETENTELRRDRARLTEALKLAQPFAHAQVRDCFKKTCSTGGGITCRACDNADRIINTLAEIQEKAQ